LWVWYWLLFGILMLLQLDHHHVWPELTLQPVGRSMKG